MIVAHAGFWLAGEGDRSSEMTRARARVAATELISMPGSELGIQSIKPMCLSARDMIRTAGPAET